MNEEKKDLDSFVQFYALIVDHPECTIIKEECSSNMYNRTKKTISIKNAELAKEEDIIALGTDDISTKEYIVREVVQTSQYPSREQVYAVSTSELFARLLSDLQHRNIRIRVLVGDDAYVATPMFMADIRREIEKAIEYRMRAYALKHTIGWGGKSDAE